MICKFLTEHINKKIIVYTKGNGSFNFIPFIISNDYVSGKAIVMGDREDEAVIRINDISMVRIKGV